MDVDLIDDAAGIHNNRARCDGHSPGDQPRVGHGQRVFARFSCRVVHSLLAPLVAAPARVTAPSEDLKPWNLKKSRQDAAIPCAGHGDGPGRIEARDMSNAPEAMVTAEATPPVLAAQCDPNWDYISARRRCSPHPDSMD